MEINNEDSVEQKPSLLVRNKYLILWLGTGVVLTIIFGMIYLAVQQDLRQSANDPQIQLARDYAAAFTAGESVPSFDNQSKTDISKSLAPYLMIYDTDGKSLASTAELDGAAPTVPVGALKSADKKGINYVTWQPKSGVRSAIVIAPFKGQTQSGYVVVGKSLQEVEKREVFTFEAVAVFWAACIVLVTLLFLFVKVIFSEK
jgi:hypothetical protein